jgi:hypothetical protein
MRVPTNACDFSKIRAMRGIAKGGSYAKSVWAGNGQLIASKSELGYLTSIILDAAT